MIWSPQNGRAKGKTAMGIAWDWVPQYRTKSQGQSSGVSCSSKSLSRNGRPTHALFCWPLLKPRILNIPARLLGKSTEKTSWIITTIYHMTKTIGLREHLQLLLTPHLWHHFLLKRYEITILLEQSFHPEARGVRAVCFTLSSLLPTHFLCYCRGISELFVIFRQVSSPKLLNRLPAVSQLTDGWKGQQCCKVLSK